ncbi:MAG: polyprenyl diphosphate synthase [Candidatus Onthovivens sp.]|nr:polyprenyl diphosphate synthase [Candidatus Onthovivens sp.]
MNDFVLTKKINHIAIIMDGNGRRAKKRGLPRTCGHREGCKRIIEIFDLCKKYNIKVFTLYAFSTENRNRPKDEIDCLFNYLDDFFDKNIKKFIEEGVRVQHMGDISKLPSHTQDILNEALELTKNNNKYVFNICLNYGSRQEIVRACKKLYTDISTGKINEDDIDTNTFYKYLDSGNLPEVDLLIRTSGEKRLSNFLLYQVAYTEFIFTSTYWPDFKEKQLIECLKEYCERDRRFGRIEEDK